MSFESHFKKTEVELVNHLFQLKRPLQFRFRISRVSSHFPGDVGRFVQSLIHTSVAAFLLMIIIYLILGLNMGVAVKPEISLEGIATSVIGLIALFATIHWNNVQRFNQKWSECRKSYNRIHGGNEGTKVSRDLQSCALAYELIILGVWNHRSFFSFFERQVALAFLHKFMREKKTLAEAESSWRSYQKIEIDDAFNWIEYRKQDLLEELLASPTDSDKLLKMAQSFAEAIPNISELQKSLDPTSNFLKLLTGVKMSETVMTSQAQVFEKENMNAQDLPPSSIKRKRGKVNS